LSRLPIFLFCAIAALFFAAGIPVSHAESGPFAGLSGNWSGGGTVALAGGPRERIRCRAH
jgi:membrane associated rhomboid family serine protease